MRFINRENGLFIYQDEKEVGKAICHYTEDSVDIRHVIVDPSMRGRGLAAQLVERVVNEAEKKEQKIIPTCSYAAWWLENNK